MTFAELLAIAIGLAMDAFAVSLAVGTTSYARGVRPVFRLAFHFGLFQFLMPIVGWFLGVSISLWIKSWDHWVAFGLLAYVGGHMMMAGLGSEAATYPSDPTRKWSLMLLCVATSLDALAVGLSLAMMRLSIWYPSVVIGVVASAMSLLGIKLGHRVGRRFGKKMEVVGGVLLFIIGLRILLHDLLF